MAKILFENVDVEFPVYDVKSRSLKNSFLSIATGGTISGEIGESCFVKALTDITFELKDGDRVAIIGNNGAGKSTLLRTLNGIYTPTSGNVCIEGDTGSLIDISLGIDPDATGRENVFIRAGLLGLKRSLIESNLDEIIKFSELGDYIDIPVRTYSSGMHMRLAFAVSTIVQPEILIMDEWLSVGDFKFQKKVEDRLNGLINKTKILIIGTHSKNLIARACNKVIWLEHGMLKDIGAPKSIITRYFK